MSLFLKNILFNEQCISVLTMSTNQQSKSCKTIFKCGKIYGSLYSYFTISSEKRKLYLNLTWHLQFGNQSENLNENMITTYYVKYLIDITHNFVNSDCSTA